MVTSPFRTDPILGPGLRQTDTQYHWDTIAGKTIAGADVGPSYPLGTIVWGNDGHSYVHAKATPAFAANARMDINETTWAATANAAGAWMAPVAVAAGANFHARRFVI